MPLQTWSNLADTLALYGAAYGEAMRAYERACQLSTSEAGDDLPGLLHNWGVGLHSLGTHAQVRAHSPGVQWGPMSCTSVLSGWWLPVAS